VVFAVRESALVVPEEALVPQGARQFLFKVVDGPDGKKVSQRLEAKIGLRIPGKVEILAGLQVGDQVVTAGHTRLLRADSVPVRVIDLTRPLQGPGGGRPPGAASGAKPGGGAVSAPAAGSAAAPAMAAPVNGAASTPTGRPVAQP
jgi:membrane fusion protein (multidrug efflux system)